MNWLRVLGVNLLMGALGGLVLGGIVGIATQPSEVKETAFVVAILGVAGAVAISMGSLLLYILEASIPLIDQLAKFVAEELPGMLRQVGRILLYAVVVQITQFILEYLGMGSLVNLPEYTGLAAGALLGWVAPSSGQDIQDS